MSEVNALDSAVYGGKNSYYDKSSYTSFSDNAPHFSSVPSSPTKLTSINTHQSPSSTTTKSLGTSSFKPHYSTLDTYNSNYQTDTHRYCPTSVLEKPVTKPNNAIAKPFGTSQTDNIFNSTALAKPLDSQYISSSDAYGDNYHSSEYGTNTTKLPGGYKTDSYKYETYHSSSKPVDSFSSTTEKFYTSLPSEKLQFTPIKGEYDNFKNGSSADYQSSYSSNLQLVNEPPVLLDSDSLEQKMLKKSVRQQIIEKKTVTTTRSSKQESSSKTFRLE